MVRKIAQGKSTYTEAGYPDRLGPSGKFVENSTKLNLPWNDRLSNQYSAVFWLLEFQIRRCLDAGTYCKR